MSNNRSNENKGKREKTSLTLEEPLVFGDTYETKITTLRKLSKTIAGLFDGAFQDFVGCNIVPEVNTGQLKLALFFKDNGGNDIIPLDHIQNNNRGVRPSIANRISSFNARNRNKTLELSQDLKDVLSDFIPTGRKNNVNWNQHVTEVTTQSTIGYTIYIQVTGFDINRILKVLYGGQDEDGSRIDYNIQVLRPIGQINYSANQDYLVSILKVNNKAVEELTKDVGMMPSVGDIPMVRA